MREVEGTVTLWRPTGPSELDAEFRSDATAAN